MRLFPIAALFAAITLGADARPLDKPSIVATAIRLDPGDPGRVRVGALRYLGGWVLTSRDGRFGSISSIHAQRGRFVALSDTGLLFRFRMGNRSRITDVEFLPLPGVPNPRDDKDGRDSESLQVDLATGRAWVGFEQYGQVWRYAPGFTHAEAHVAPPAMAKWPTNGGPEAMVRLRDGRFVIFSEEQGGPGDTREALLFAGDPVDPGTPPPIRFFYRGVPGYVPTDAGELPDGRVLLLNRHFTLLDGVSASVTVIDPRAIAAEAIVPAQEIARLLPPLTIDNMEALSIEREQGRTILWIASDDNQKPVQRTLLMKFVLEEGPRRRGP